MASWPLIGDISTKAALGNAKKGSLERGTSIAQADIAIARMHSDNYAAFLDDAQDCLDKETVNPRHISALVSRSNKGYSPSLLRSALHALTKARSDAFARQIIARIDSLHQAYGAHAFDDVDPSRLLHPAGIR